MQSAPTDLFHFEFPVFHSPYPRFVLKVEEVTFNRDALRDSGLVLPSSDSSPGQVDDPGSATATAAASSEEASGSDHVSDDGLPLTFPLIEAHGDQVQRGTVTHWHVEVCRLRVREYLSLLIRRLRVISG